MVYLLALIIASCLVTGQLLWAGTVKGITGDQGSVAALTLIQKMLFQPRFWLGVLAYLIGTGCYFLLLSKAKFFSVQVTMTGLGIILSVLASHFIFKEHLNAGNVLGMVLVLTGIALVFNR